MVVARGLYLVRHLFTFCNFKNERNHRFIFQRRLWSAKQLTHRGRKVQSTSPLLTRCPRGNTGAKGIQINVDDERHYDIKNSRILREAWQEVKTWQMLEEFSKIIRWKIKQTTASGQKFAKWHLGTLGKIYLLQRRRQARAAKSMFFSASESMQLWRCSYFVKTGLDYLNLAIIAHGLMIWGNKEKLTTYVSGL